MNPLFAWIYGLLGAALLGTELYGVFTRRKGTTVTSGERWIDRWLSLHFPAGRWLFRVWIGGVLVWMILHFLVGVS